MFGTNEANEIFGGLIFEAAEDRKIFEEAGGAGAIDDFGEKQLRSQAMATALAWVANGDYSYDALDESLAIVADLDGDEELTDDEEEYYDDLLEEVAAAFAALGASEDNIKAFIDDESDDEGIKLGSFLTEKMDGTEKDDETIISDYAVSDAPIFEGLVKVIRAGKVALVKRKKRVGRRMLFGGRRKKLTAAQKAGLKLARRKAFTGAAKRARKKSMRLRKKMGL